MKRQTHIVMKQRTNIVPTMSHPSRKAKSGSIINFIHIPKNGGTSMLAICAENSKLLRYHSHNADVYNKHLSNQLVIIRDPIDRFISSVYYAIQRWSHEPQIQNLISKNIDTPEKWVQVWSDPTHIYYNDLMKEIMNKNHLIGNKKHKYKWTYSQQSLWINNPKFVILMDNFNNDLNYFIKKHNLKSSDLQKLNSTNRIDETLSIESINFLRNFYKEDYILYEKYKHMSIEERL